MAAKANNDPEPPQDSLQPGGATITQLLVLRSTTPEEEIHWRTAKNSRGTDVLVDGQPLQLAYVTARFVQDTLDEVVGPQNWQTNFVDVPGGVRCGIGIRMYDHTGSERDDWVWKYDVGIPSNIEAVKGAHSDAFKRAGVQWGIARDLYEERDADVGVEPAPQQAAPRPVPIRQRMDAPPARGVRVAPQQTQYAEDGPAPEPEGDWVCPIHNDVKVVEAGISRKSGKAYDAFLACPVPGCDQKEPYRR